MLLAFVPGVSHRRGVRVARHNRIRETRFELHRHGAMSGSLRPAAGLIRITLRARLKPAGFGNPGRTL